VEEVEGGEARHTKGKGWLHIAELMKDETQRMRDAPRKWN